MKRWVTLCLLGLLCGVPYLSRADAQNAFIAPFAVAVGPGNVIYVADPGAQRIFTWKNGAVRTLAGSGTVDGATGVVPGGYRDGPADRARFNAPLALAVTQDGSVLVADSRNHAIRRIRNGIVTTVAGAPGRTAAVNGSVKAAGFALPVGLTLDRTKIYVADYGGGVRLIDGGVVSSPHIPGATPFVRSVAYARDAKHRCLYIVNRDHGAFSLFDFFIDTNQRDNLGTVPSGLGGGIAALSSTEIVEADAASRSVKYWYRNSLGTPFQVGYQVRLAGRDSEDDSGSTGGTRAQSAAGRAFQMPSGVAVLGGNSVVVADPSARTVSVVHGLDRRHPVSEDIADLELPATTYRVAFLSNSFAFHKVDYAHSIGQIIEDRLNANRARSGMPRPARVRTVMLSPIDLSSTCDYVDNYLSFGNYDLIVLMLNGAHFRRELEYHPKLSRDPALYQPELAKCLRRTNAVVRKSGSNLLIALQLEASEASLLEGGWSHDTQDADMEKFSNAQRLENLRIVQLAGVDFSDTYEEMLAAERGSHRVPLFGTNDGHLNVEGARITAEAIAKGIIERHPWHKR